MARVTVEDCIDKIPNRYELLMVATQRAKDISSGAPIMVSRDNDKNPVIALREIEPFSGFLIDNEVSDSMQVHGVDDDNLDLDSEDAADGDIDVDLDGDDELGFDEGGEMGDDGLDDFDEE